MASGWKRAMHYLGLVEDFEDDYADLSSDPLGAPMPSEPIAPPRRQPTNVRRLGEDGDDPVAAGVGAGGGGGGTGPAVQPSPVAPTGTVNVLTPAVQEEPANTGEDRVAAHVKVTSPSTFNDVEEVGQHFRDGVPVVMNLQGASENIAKRLLDFASGLIYGLAGTIERTGDRIFLLTPDGVTIADDERQRLRDRGLLSRAT